MDKITAQRVVRETFKAAFDKKRYRNFINELCNGFDEGKAQNMGVPDAFSPHVKSCQRLGTFESTDGELADVLIVHLTESYKLERTRTALRDFVAHKLKRDESYKEAGLVAFVAPDSQSWRFSFVRMEYETKRDPTTGKIKPEERLTPARRYSYIVGADEECHTAQSRFLALLQDTSGKPTLSQIEETFSVESVTKEFFAKYAALFASTQVALDAIVKKDAILRADFAAKNVTTVDFAKKLLGQIVFLYFIQKKGWLGVPKGGKWGDGPRNFLRKLADTAIHEKKCLFNDVLEPLFYDTLATDRGHEAWCKEFGCRIPFLNGGLFEPLAGYDWERTNISFANSLFTNQERTPTGDTGSGILDVFDRYNFTVNEAEPLEKEVAIDPEMLGKVFENLIEENRRKGLGAFYTPREIVHYMCQESLINYLENGLNHPAKPRSGQPIVVPRKEVEDWIRQNEQFAHYAAAIAAGTKGDHYPKPPESIRKFSAEIDILLRDITVCDPAIGSGAFPVGMMTEIVRARVSLTPYFSEKAERTPYHFKRHAIQSSIYGADIDAGAVEIAKLRLWLSLVVDEDDVQQIKPLPNLDYKIVAGNSLLGVEKNLFNYEQFKLLEDLKPRFFNESDRRKKELFKKQIENLIDQLTNGKKIFDFEIYFSEVFHAKGGFDVIIANPPYNELRDLEEDQQSVYKKSAYYDSARGGRVNLFQFFYPLSLAISGKPAIICLITQNSLLAEDSALRNRRLIVEKSQIIKFVSFPERDDPNKRVFESAKMSVCIGILKTVMVPLADYEFDITVWHDRNFSAGHSLRVRMSEIKGVFPDSLIFPMSNELSFGLLKKIKMTKDVYFVNAKSGEIDMTIYKSRFNVSGKGKRVLTGAQVLRFRTTVEPSQGAVYFLDGALTDISKEKREDTLAQRLVMQRITGVDSNRRLIMTIVPKDTLCSNSTNYISANTHSDLEYVLGVLNSRVINYYFKQTSTNTNVTTGEVNRIPIPIPSTSTLQKITKLVAAISTKKECESDADTKELEGKIDDLVYSLYNLTLDEIKLVEGNGR